MLRLRACILTHLLSSHSASPISPLHRLLSTAAVSPSPRFAVEEYLVETCGLTREQALKASGKVSHLKSPSKPEAVLAFLAGLGLSSADVSALVAKDPVFLCASVEKTLEPVVTGLAGLGLSRDAIARLVSNGIRFRSVVSHVKLLRDCELSACDIAKLRPRILTTNSERIRAMFVCIEGLGVPRHSPMFRHALEAVSFSNEEKIAAKMEYLKKTCGWSDAELGIAVSKAPCVLVKSKEMLQRRSDFPISEVGLEPAYIAHRSPLLAYSLEGRLRPRHFVLKFLKENGLLEHDPSYYTAVCVSENVFIKKFICPHEEAAPHLAEDYAAACRGEVPANFRFT